MCCGDCGGAFAPEIDQAQVEQSIKQQELSEKLCLQMT